MGLSLWRRISKPKILSLWLSGYFVGTSTFIGRTVSLVAILYCCGWETAEKQRLLQKEILQGQSLLLELLRTSNECVRISSEVLRLRECADNKGRHLTDTIFRKWILSLKCFEIKLILVINSRKKIVYFSFYCNFKIVRFSGGPCINSKLFFVSCFNPLNAELNPICHLLALLWAHRILHVSRIRVKYVSNFSIYIKGYQYFYVWKRRAFMPVINSVF